MLLKLFKFSPIFLIVGIVLVLSYTSKKQYETIPYALDHTEEDYRLALTNFSHTVTPLDEFIVDFNQALGQSWEESNYEKENFYLTTHSEGFLFHDEYYDTKKNLLKNAGISYRLRTRRKTPSLYEAPHISNIKRWLSNNITRTEIQAKIRQGTVEGKITQSLEIRSQFPYNKSNLPGDIAIERGVPRKDIFVKKLIQIDHLISNPEKKRQVQKLNLCIQNHLNKKIDIKSINNFLTNEQEVENIQHEKFIECLPRDLVKEISPGRNFYQDLLKNSVARGYYLHPYQTILKNIVFTESQLKLESTHEYLTFRIRSHINYNSNLGIGGNPNQVLLISLDIVYQAVPKLSGPYIFLEVGITRNIGHLSKEVPDKPINQKELRKLQIHFTEMLASQMRIKGHEFDLFTIPKRAWIKNSTP
jgi:hypothetical protein